MSESYEFGEKTITTFIWLDRGLLFNNPSTLEIEMISAGAFGVEVVRMDGTVAGKADRPNAHGGWSTFDFRQGGEFGSGILNGRYKIKLTNLGMGNRHIKSGALEYDV